MVDSSRVQRSRAQRFESNMTAELSVSAKAEPMSCFVLNVSETGVELQVPAANSVPDVFHLSMPGSDQSAECIVVRRPSKHELSAIFEKAPNFK